MRNMIQYIICWMLLPFSKWVNIQYSHVHYIRYRQSRGSVGNTIKISNSNIRKCILNLNGNNNAIVIENDAVLSNCEIHVWGDNNKVIINGTNGALSITIRGCMCMVKTGKQQGLQLKGTQFYCMGKGNSITVGDNCLFADDVEIWNTDSHLITDSQDNPLNKSMPVEIGNHVWIGKHTRILKNVRIADNSIVGMSSVVTHNIPSCCIAVGNPAKVVKRGVNWREGFITL